MLLKPAHLRRAAHIAAVFSRHGLANLVVSSGVGAALGMRPTAPEQEEKRSDQAARLRAALTDLGPTFIKAGQFLSTRPDLIPAEYIAELSTLQDSVPRIPFDEVRAVVEEELGLTLSEAFRRVNPEPRAAASLAQVHDAELHTGEKVVLKVQRPDITSPIRRDLELMHDLAAWMAEHAEAGRIYDFPGVVRELETSLRDELNYRIEASNMRLFAANLAEFDHVRVPRVYPELSTGCLLTMERIEGVKATDWDPRGREQRAALLAREFIEAYLKQIALDGVVHSDPHAGNFLVDQHGNLVIMDFGMVFHVDEKLRGDFVRLLISYAEGDAYHAAETLLDISSVPPEADVHGFRDEVSHLMARDQHLPPEESLDGLVLLQVTQVAYRYRIRVPATTTMLGKTLFSMSAIARHLDPRMDLFAITREYLTDAVLIHRIRQYTPGRAYRNLGEVEQMATYAPMRINRILDILSDNQLRLMVHTPGMADLLDGLQKIANRIALGAISGSLIIGSALAMAYDVGPRLWGYPLISTIFFLAAATLSLSMAISIVIHDRKH